MPCEGLSLAALRAFAAARAGARYAVPPSGTAEGEAESLPFERLTTTQVVEHVIRPETQRGNGSGCTYAELLLAQARAVPRLQWHAPSAR